MVLESIDESNRMSVKNFLRWVTFAFRPVSGYRTCRSRKIVPVLTHL